LPDPPFPRWVPSGFSGVARPGGRPLEPASEGGRCDEPRLEYRVRQHTGNVGVGAGFPRPLEQPRSQSCWARLPVSMTTSRCSSFAAATSLRRCCAVRSLPALLSCVVVVVPRPGRAPWQEFGSEPAFRLHHERFRLLAARIRGRPVHRAWCASACRRDCRSATSHRRLVEAYIRAQGCYQD